ncbi:MAG TPA: PspC domain-containing protein [Candidatus Saccharimonadales bacterium]|nr:PspC domain-containing protein [Candidatus Saccharimonadales bacterium]
MKEITRIHIAKVSYEAEIEAKRELEAYLKTLEAYSEDADILDDVEVRITEILADRGVKPGGVIAMKDIKALEEQLGEPRDFMGTGDIAVGPEDEEMTTDASRKLFRDIDHAVVGGVLSGVAAFFKISPALVRVLFIIIVFASFGTALLVYIVLWIAVPAAKSAADKLQMAGVPVTLASIRQLNESEEHVRRGDNSQARRTLLTVLGIFSVLGALGAAVVTIFVVTAVIVGGYGNHLGTGEGSGFLIAAFVLAVVSGVLFTTLCILGAYAAFAMRATKRVLISMGVIVVVGLASFGTAIGLAQYASLRYENAIKASTRETSIAMPEGSAKMTSFVVDAPTVHVRYIVSKDTPKAVVKTVGMQAPQTMKLSLDGTTLKLTDTQHSQNTCKVFWCEGPFITIYGPPLDQLTAENQTNVDYSGANQAQMTLIANDGADIVLSAGAIDMLTLTAKKGADASLEAIAVSTANVTVESGTNLEFGTIANFTLHAPTSCPVEGKAHLELAGINSKNFTLNDQQTPSQSIAAACIDITIEREKFHD